MAGAGKGEIRYAVIAEATPGTTPTTPGFTTIPAENVDFKATPIIVEDRSASAGFRVNELGRSGQDITGSMSGKLRYGVFDTLLETLFQSAWATNVLKDSVSGRQTVTIENTVPQGQGGTSAFFRYLGVEALKGKLSAEAGKDSTLEMEFIGTEASDATASAISGATYTAPTAQPLFGSASGLGSITIGAFTVPCIRKMDISFDLADKEGQQRLFSDILCGVDRGMMMVTAEMELYVEDGVLQLYNAGLNGTTDFAVTITLGTVSASKYTLSLPRCQVVDGNLDLSGNRPFQTLKITALYNAATTCVAQITRAVA